MTTTAIERLKRLPIFSEQDYLRLNPDVVPAGIDACDHALNHAGAEDRPMFSPNRLARAWGDAIRRTGDAPQPGHARITADDIAGFERRFGKISIFVNSRSEFRARSMASCLMESLASTGFQVSLADETADPDGDHGLPVIVAPHEFFSLRDGPLWSRSKLLERSIVFNTLPVHVPEFKRALPALLAARGVLDTSPQITVMFGEAAVPALHAQFRAPARERWLERSDLDHPLVRALPAAAQSLTFDPSEWDNRPIDLASFGTHSPRRGAFFGRHAADLARHSAFIYHQQGGRDSLDERVERRAHGRIAGHLSGHAKITLNITDDEFHSFDWFRAVHQTMASGSVLVSDFCPPHPVFKAGMHLFKDDTRHIPGLLRWLLTDDDGKRAAQEVRSRTMAWLNDHDEQASRAHEIARFILSTIHAPLRDA